MNKKTNGSLDNFKEWMYNDNPKNKFKFVGHYVESRINKKKLMEKITLEDDHGEDEEFFLKKIVQDFAKNGGNVIDRYSNDTVLIEVSTGKFTIHEYFVNFCD